MTEKIQYDLILKNGIVVLPAETTQVDIGIKDEKIHTIGSLTECDTNNVIEFNSSFSDEIKDNKKRSFWDLLKTE